MKWFFKIMLPALVLVSCSKESGSLMDSGSVSTPRNEAVAHDEIVLGKKLDNPYSIENVRNTLKSLYPTRGATEIDPNGLYVRFLPANSEQLDQLAGLGLEMFDHPLDYEILRDGDYYHDRSLPEDQITWQYTVVPPDFKFPAGTTYEILEECFVPDEEIPTRGFEEVDWDRVEKEAFRRTGNEALILPDTRGNRTYPKGRITIEDKQSKEGKVLGVAGVKVKTQVFVRISSAYTDKDGNYEIRMKYSAKPHYRLVFKNTCDFSIGFNLILSPASTSSLGKGSPLGMDVKIDTNSDGTLFRRCVVNNAAYDYISKCREMGISGPPKNLRIWIFKQMRPSSALMLHHGAVLNQNALDKFLGLYRYLIRVILPDITIGARGRNDYASLYGATVHEMAHASHFQRVGTTYWDKYITYVLTAFAGTGATYGDGSGANAGYCEVGEMWAYYLENKLYKSRYGYSPESGYDLWFYPQIFAQLEEEGIDVSDLFSALRSDVHDRDALLKKLVEICPSMKTVITRIFRSYS